MASVAVDRGQSGGKIVWLVLLTSLSVLLNYIDRGAIGIAAPLMKAELGLSATTFGLAVSAFFWVYTPLNVVVGWLSDRYCVYRIFAVGVLVFSLSTLLTGFVGGLAALIALRLVLGLGESVAIPGSSKIFAAKVPPAHRGLANASVAFAVGFGPTIGTVAGGLILASFGWRQIFFVFGLATMLWLIPWHVVSAPFRHEGSRSAPPPTVPFSRLLRMPALWKMGVANFCSNYGFYFVLTWMPLYLTQARGYTIGEMTAISSLGFLSPLLAPVMGRWSDVLVARGADEDRVRRAIMVVSLAGAAAALAGTVLSETTTALVFWTAFGGICTSGGATNLFAVGQIFSGPRAAGSWIGVQNTVGNLAGIIGPVITGLTIDRLGGYGWGFALASGFAGLGALWWLFVIPPIREITAPAAPAGG